MENLQEFINWWMNLIQNHCTNLEDKAHVIVIGSHADEVKKAQGDPWSKESIIIFPHYQKFPSLKFAGFIPMDCRFTDSDAMKQARKLLQKSAAVLCSPETINLNAHTFYIYLLDSFKENLAVQLREVQQQIYSDVAMTQSKKMKDILTFIPTTLLRLAEICDQLSRKGLILFLRNKSTPEDSFIVCDCTTLLSRVTGTVFAPENFKQHCHLASSTGVVPLIKFCLQFKSLNAEMLISFMTHLELCYEIKDKELVDGIAELVETTGQAEADPDSRYLFFPELIRLETPEKVWSEKPAMSYHFGWVLQTVLSHQFFDPHSFQVTVLRMVVSFGLAPANTLKSDLPSIQQRCSVLKNGICWGNEYGFIHLELLNNGKYLVVKIRSNILEPELLLARYEVVTKILNTVKDFCSNIETIESVIAPEQVVKHPLQPVVSLTLCTVPDIAKAVLSKAANVKSLHDPQPLKDLLQFEPYAGLDHNTLQHIHSDKNAMKNEKISSAFISHFADQATKPDRTVKLDHVQQCVYMYCKILSCTQAASAQQGDPRQELVQALKTWRSKTEGTYSCLRETLNKYSVFTDRNPLDLAGVAHEEIHSSTLSTADSDQLPLTKRVTVAELMDKYKIEAEQMDQEIEQRDIAIIAGYFDDVKLYVDIMQLSRSEQADIQREAVISGNQVAVINCLKYWIHCNPSAATYRELVDILLSLKKEAIGVDVCKFLQESLHNAQESTQ